MKYYVELCYNNCSIGSNFSMLVDKEKHVSQLIDSGALRNCQLFENVTRHPTSIHPRANGVLLTFTLSVETNTLTMYQVKEMFSIDPDVVIEVREV